MNYKTVCNISLYSQKFQSNFFLEESVAGGRYICNTIFVHWKDINGVSLLEII